MYFFGLIGGLCINSGHSKSAPIVGHSSQGAMPKRERNVLDFLYFGSTLNLAKNAQIDIYARVHLP
jgi:hypothetical protein